MVDRKKKEPKKGEANSPVAVPLGVVPGQHHTADEAMHDRAHREVAALAASFEVALKTKAGRNGGPVDGIQVVVMGLKMLDTGLRVAIAHPDLAAAVIEVLDEVPEDRAPLVEGFRRRMSGEDPMYRLSRADEMGMTDTSSEKPDKPRWIN